MRKPQLIGGGGGGAGAPPPPPPPHRPRRPRAPPAPRPADVRNGPWHLVPALFATTVVVSVLGYVQKLPCRGVGFDFVPTVRNACYTDVYPLYFGRGLADGKIPYLDKIPEPVEYPVLTGGFMHVVAVVSRWFGGADPGARGLWFSHLPNAAPFLSPAA